jgi:hypothetical protein
VDNRKVGDMLNSSVPIVVDLGTASRKRIRKLKDGYGKLEAEVQDVLAQIRGELGADAENKELMPIVVVYSRKGKRQRSVIDRIF